MIDPYDPYHPDGPDDADDLPGGPMASSSWLDGEARSLIAESLRCGACGQPAASWAYLVGTGEDGNTMIDGFAVCAAHQAAA